MAIVLLQLPPCHAFLCLLQQQSIFVALVVVFMALRRAVGQVANVDGPKAQAVSEIKHYWSKAREEVAKLGSQPPVASSADLTTSKKVSLEALQPAVDAFEQAIGAARRYAGHPWEGDSCQIWIELGQLALKHDHVPLAVNALGEAHLATTLLKQQDVASAANTTIALKEYGTALLRLGSAVHGRVQQLVQQAKGSGSAAADATNPTLIASDIASRQVAAYDLLFAARFYLRRLRDIQTACHGPDDQLLLNTLLLLSQASSQQQRMDVALECLQTNIRIKQSKALPTATAEKSLQQVQSWLDGVKGRGVKAERAVKAMWEKDDLACDEFAQREALCGEAWKMICALYGMCKRAAETMRPALKPRELRGVPSTALQSQHASPPPQKQPPSAIAPPPSASAAPEGRPTALSSSPPPPLSVPPHDDAVSAVARFRALVESGKVAVQAKMLSEAERDLSLAVELMVSLPMVMVHERPLLGSAEAASALPSTSLTSDERRVALSCLAFVNCMKAQWQTIKGGHDYRLLMKSAIPLYKEVIELCEQDLEGVDRQARAAAATAAGSNGKSAESIQRTKKSAVLEAIAPSTAFKLQGRPSSDANLTSATGPSLSAEAKLDAIKAQLQSLTVQQATAMSHLAVVACNVEKLDPGLLLLRESAHLKRICGLDVTTEERHIAIVERNVAKKDAEALASAAEQFRVRTGTILVDASCHVEDFQTTLAVAKQLIAEKKHTEAEPAMLKCLVMQQRLSVAALGGKSSGIKPDAMRQTWLAAGAMYYAMANAQPKGAAAAVAINELALHCFATASESTPGADPSQPIPGTFGPPGSTKEVTTAAAQLSAGLAFNAGCALFNLKRYDRAQQSFQRSADVRRAHGMPSDTAENNVQGLVNRVVKSLFEDPDLALMLKAESSMMLSPAKSMMLASSFAPSTVASPTATTTRAVNDWQSDGEDDDDRGGGGDDSADLSEVSAASDSSLSFNIVRQRKQQRATGGGCMTDAAGPPVGAARAGGPAVPDLLEASAFDNDTAAAFQRLRQLQAVSHQFYAQLCDAKTQLQKEELAARIGTVLPSAEHEMRDAITDDRLCQLKALAFDLAFTILVSNEATVRQFKQGWAEQEHAELGAVTFLVHRVQGQESLAFHRLCAAGCEAQAEAIATDLGRRAQLDAVDMEKSWTVAQDEPFRRAEQERTFGAQLVVILTDAARTRQQIEECERRNRLVKEEQRVRFETSRETMARDAIARNAWRRAEAAYHGFRRAILQHREESNRLQEVAEPESRRRVADGEFESVLSQLRLVEAAARRLVAASVHVRLISEVEARSRRGLESLSLCAYGSFPTTSSSPPPSPSSPQLDATQPALALVIAPTSTLFHDALLDRFAICFRVVASEWIRDCSSVMRKCVEEHEAHLRRRRILEPEQRDRLLCEEAFHRDQQERLASTFIAHAHQRRETTMLEQTEAHRRSDEAEDYQRQLHNAFCDAVRECECTGRASAVAEAEVTRQRVFLDLCLMLEALAREDLQQRGGLPSQRTTAPSASATSSSPASTPDERELVRAAFVAGAASVMVNYDLAALQRAVSDEEVAARLHDITTPEPCHRLVACELSARRQVEAEEFTAFVRCDANVESKKLAMQQSEEQGRHALGVCDELDARLRLYTVAAPAFAARWYVHFAGTMIEFAEVALRMQTAAGSGLQLCTATASSGDVADRSVNRVPPPPPRSILDAASSDDDQPHRTPADAAGPPRHLSTGSSAAVLYGGRRPWKADPTKRWQRVTRQTLSFRAALVDDDPHSGSLSPAGPTGDTSSSSSSRMWHHMVHAERQRLRFLEDALRDRDASMLRHLYGDASHGPPSAAAIVDLLDCNTPVNLSALDGERRVESVVWWTGAVRLLPTMCRLGRLAIAHQEAMVRCCGATILFSSSSAMMMTTTTCGEATSFFSALDEARDRTQQLERETRSRYRQYEINQREAAGREAIVHGVHVDQVSQMFPSWMLVLVADVVDPWLLACHSIFLEYVTSAMVNVMAPFAADIALQVSTFQDAAAMSLLALQEEHQRTQLIRDHHQHGHVTACGGFLVSTEDMLRRRNESMEARAFLEQVRLPECEAAAFASHRHVTAMWLSAHVIVAEEHLGRATLQREGDMVVQSDVVLAREQRDLLVYETEDREYWSVAAFAAFDVRDVHAGAAPPLLASQRSRCVNADADANQNAAGIMSGGGTASSTSPQTSSLTPTSSSRKKPVVSAYGVIVPRPPRSLFFILHKVLLDRENVHRWEAEYEAQVELHKLLLREVQYRHFTIRTKSLEPFLFSCHVLGLTEVKERLTLLAAAETSFELKAREELCDMALHSQYDAIVSEEAVEWTLSIAHPWSAASLLNEYAVDPLRPCLVEQEQVHRLFILVREERLEFSNIQIVERSRRLHAVPDATFEPQFISVQQQRKAARKYLSAAAAADVWQLQIPAASAAAAAPVRSGDGAVGSTAAIDGGGMSLPPPKAPSPAAAATSHVETHERYQRYRETQAEALAWRLLESDHMLWSRLGCAKALYRRHARDLQGLVMESLTALVRLDSQRPPSSMAGSRSGGTS